MKTNAGSLRIMRIKPQIPAEIEDYRDERWRREGHRQVETAFDAERFIEQVGFAACLTDSPPAGAVTLRRGLRPARRDHAAQRAEGSRGLADVGVEGRHRPRAARSTTRSSRAARPCSLRRG